MLLAIDIGNTNIVLGIYEGKDLLGNWRIGTKEERTADEYGILIRDIFQASQLFMEDVDAIAISCVVPPLVNAFEEMALKYFNITPFFINPGIRTGMPILYDDPREVGADRIVNAVAAYEKYRRSLIIVDFGTATTFDCISERGEYLGGLIAPGITISLEALFQRASKLPRIEISRPKAVIGKNTISSMQAGIIYGYVGLVDGIVERIKEEMKTDPKVIATGGLAKIIVSESKTIQEIDEYLTLEGLRIIYYLNK